MLMIYGTHEFQNKSLVEIVKEIKQHVPTAEVIVFAPDPFTGDAQRKFNPPEKSNNGSSDLPVAPQEPPLLDPPMTSLAEDEKAKIRQAIARYGNLDMVAKVLGIGRTTLWRRMKKYGIKRHYSAEPPE
jgi:DNA-binding NtrC family response regulator